VSSLLQVARPPERALLSLRRRLRLLPGAGWHAGSGWWATGSSPFPSQRDDLALRFPDTDTPHNSTPRFISSNRGRVTRGAEAVFRSLAGVWRWPLWLYEHLPGCAAFSEFTYRFVARHRTCLSQGLPP